MTAPNAAKCKVIQQARCFPKDIGFWLNAAIFKDMTHVSS